MEKSKKDLKEAIQKASEQIQFPEVKQIYEGIYEFRSGDCVIRGNKQGMEDIDKELLNLLKNYK